MQWRRLAGIAGASCALLLLLAGISTIALLQRERIRDLGRQPEVADTPAPTDLFIVPAFDQHAGQQFTVLGVFSATPDHGVLLPGLSAPLSPGQAAVSPALARLIRQDERLAARYPDIVVLHQSGVASADELFAYVAAPPGRPIPEGAVRVSTFGQPHSQLSVPLVLPWFVGLDRTMVLGIAGATVIPAFLVLWVGVNAGSRTRNARWQVLHYLGASRSQLRRLAAAETLWLTAPTVGTCSAAYSALTDHLNAIPIVGRAVFPGDLRPPLDLTATAICMVVVGGAMIGWWSRGDSASISGLSAFMVLHTPAARLLPLLLALIAIGSGLALPEARWLMIVGFFAIIAGVPIAMPLLIRQCGLAMSESGAFIAFLSGRILSRESVPLARSLASIASVTVIALLAAAYFAILGEQSRSTDSSQVSNVAILKWFSHDPADTMILQELLGDRMIRFMAVDPATGSVRVAASCEDLRAMAIVRGCVPGSPYALNESGEASLRRVLFGGPAPFSVGLVPSIPPDRHLSALVRIRPGETADDVRGAVGSAIVNTLGPYTIDVPSDGALRPSPLTDWLRGGTSLAISALFIAGSLALLDRIVERRREWHPLVWIGASPTLLRSLEGLILSTSFAVTEASAFIVGFIPIAIAFLAGAAPIPWKSLIVILAAILGTWLVALALIIAQPSSGTDTESPGQLAGDDAVG